eukprot:g4082.t1
MVTEIYPKTEGSFQLNPLDHNMDIRNCILCTYFYNYDTSFTRLKKAMDAISEKYPIICGRMKFHDKTGMKVEVRKNKGFHAVECYVDKTLLEAISAIRNIDQEAESISVTQPFFIADMDCCAMFNEDSPLCSIKLVHYKDHCCSLAMTIRHPIADGKRIQELQIDLARAYCNKSIREVNHDRTKLWPDIFLRNIDIGLSPNVFPRQINLNSEIKHIPNETRSMENIYLARADINQLKMKVMNQLPQGTYVSIADVTSALMWMLICELKAIREHGKQIVKTTFDLGISGTYFRFPMDFISETTVLLPPNYFGNAFVNIYVQYPKYEAQKLQSRDLFNTLVEAATAIREEFHNSRSLSGIAKNLVKVYKGNSQSNPPFIGLLSNLFKIPFDKIDFGGGGPVYSYLPSAYPNSVGRASCYSTGDKTGLIFTMEILRRDRANAISSNVLKELCPKACFLSQMTNSQLARLCFNTRARM